MPNNFYCWAGPPPQQSALHHPFPLLTVCDLQQRLGNNTASDVESLAAVEAAIRALNIGNGQTAHLGDGEAAEGLRRLGGEEEALEARDGDHRVRKPFTGAVVSSDLV